MLLKQNKKAGVTLIELLIVIAAAVALIAAGLVLFSDLQDSQRVKDETANLGNMYVAISNVFYEDSTTGLDNQQAINAGIVPDGMQVNGNVIINAWRGNVVIDDNGGSTNGFAISYANVPAGDSCVDMVKGMRKMGWDEVTNVDGGAPSGAAMASVTTDAPFGPMTIADIITLCAGPDDAITTLTFQVED